MDHSTRSSIACAARSREHQRRLDQFYTRRSVAAWCYERLWTYLWPTDYIFIEPSAGDGAISDLLPPGRFACDIDPQGDGIVKLDFFDFELPYDDRVVVVGNPPFGRNSSLAIRFFNKAACGADIIAFIVPKSFQKVSIQNRLHPHFHLRREWVVPDEAFLFDGQPKTVPTVFQIWEWSPDRRPLQVLEKVHFDFDFVSTGEADFAIQRVGADAGRIHYDISLSANAHYFIRAKFVQVEFVMRMIDFSRVVERTAGKPSLAKTELVELYVQHKKAFLEQGY